MESITYIVGLVAAEMWGKWVIAVLLGTGLLMTIRTKAIQFKLGLALKKTFRQLIYRDRSDTEGEISSFQALSTALSSTIGAGNIVGVGTAIAMGGPGAVFWMWICALLGMATKFSEIVLALTFREKDENGIWRGGPMYVYKSGLKFPIGGGIFAFFMAIVALISTNMVQSNAAASVLKGSFNIPPVVSGIIFTVCAGLVIMGGIKRLGKVTEIFVPIMAIFYLVGGLIILLINVDKILPAFALIFKAAFGGQQAIGGFTGATIAAAARFGVARGLMSNEAGAGTAPMAHAVAKVKHPVEQGIYGISEVFIDTIVVCTFTALVILVTGTWQTGVDGAAMSQNAFMVNLGVIGKSIVTLGLVFFTFSTVLGASWYGETGATYVFGKNIIVPYRILWLIFCFTGTILTLNFVWLLTDLVNGCIVFINVISIVLLSGVVSQKVKEYFSNQGRQILDHEITQHENS